MSEQREIKLKAWDKGVMYYFVEITSYIDNSLGVDVALTGYIDLHKASDDVIVIQSTGATSKNHKEIFNGDILKCNLWGDKLNGTAIVKYDAPSFYLDYYHNEDNFPEFQASLSAFPRVNSDSQFNTFLALSTFAQTCSISPALLGPIL